jgi:hypothetical protein
MNNTIKVSDPITAQIRLFINNEDTTHYLRYDAALDTCSVNQGAENLPDNERVHLIGSISLSGKLITPEPKHYRYPYWIRRIARKFYEEE